MPAIQKIHVRYVNKKKLNDLLKSLFKANTYEFEVGIHNSYDALFSWS